MKPLLQVFTYLIITLTVIICQKNSDEGRPYEFGFTIDGQQHRHEKKDENGIIQGEFGFITADGVYHVTVYATDENGNFKILSMKNIRISAPLDGSPATGPISPEAGKYLKKPNEVSTPKPAAPQPPQEFEKLQQLPAGPQAQNIITTQTSRAPYVFTTKPTLKPACAGCGYVTTAKPINGKLPPFQNSAFQKPVSNVLQQPSLNKNIPNKIPSQNTPGSELLPPGVQGGSVSPNVGLQPNPQQQNLPPPIPQGPSVIQQSQFPNRFGEPQIEAIDLSQTPGTSQTQPFVNPNYQNGNVVPNQANSQSHQDSHNFQTSHQNLNTQNSNTQQNSNTHQNLDTQQQDFSQGYKQNQNTLIQGQNGQNFQGQNLPVSGGNQPEYQNVGNAEYTNIPGIGVITNTGQLAQLNAQSNGLTGTAPPPQTSKLPPISISDNAIHVGGKNPMDIPIKDKFPGMANGLPNGVEETDVKNILYKFKYTVGFHGHYEKGLKNGTKIGGYFVNGRDGISRVVTYVADENGYRPKFKLINLGLDSSDTPKEDTEKTFGLKSFEFVWYPIE
ncbi:hypothetical protein JTB14_028895 [Gonioctena quinquepunctata]|nr:hypothetical protein JTB14_028895 [Gonioctena quinquepunctata]